MPIWSEILKEIDQTRHEDGSPNFDAVRRKYLIDLYQYTKRAVILYASCWLQKDAPANLVSIGDEDIQALMEVTSGLGSGSELDLILHSPGGSPDAAEAIVSYLRSRFSHIRDDFINAVQYHIRHSCFCKNPEFADFRHSDAVPPPS